MINSKGYVMLFIDGKKRQKHVLIAEYAMGFKLPKGASVHHVDFNKTNNLNSNLVVCESMKYHRLLHRRTIAINNNFPANYLQCQFCKKHDDPNNLYINHTNQYHRECMNNYKRNLRKRRKDNE